MLELMSEWCPYELKDLHDEKERAKVCGVSEGEIRVGVKAIVLLRSKEESMKLAQSRYDQGQWPKFYFTKGGRGGIARKTYLEDVGGKLPTNFWPFSDTGHTDEAKKEMLSIFDGVMTFDTPKPSRLIEYILKVAGNDNMLMLDSFAGSGTTAHAILKANQADHGSRNFILIEMMDYANTITAERVKRVITGYGDGKKAVPGTGGSFSYYELGEPLMLDAEHLNEKAGKDKIREYVWYTETRQPLSKADSEHPYLLGTLNHTAYYFYYELGQPTVLNYDFLATIQEKQETYIIYADKCALSDNELLKFGITFKKIPRDITRL